jgi:hypothetical protein
MAHEALLFLPLFILAVWPRRTQSQGPSAPDKR